MKIQNRHVHPLRAIPFWILRGVEKNNDGMGSGTKIKCCRGVRTKTWRGVGQKFRFHNPCACLTQKTRLWEALLWDLPYSFT